MPDGRPNPVLAGGGVEGFVATGGAGGGTGRTDFVVSFTGAGVTPPFTAWRTGFFAFAGALDETAGFAFATLALEGDEEERVERAV